jgi:hypothetical protein
MEPFNFLMVFFVSLLGYLLGVGLAYIAPEELKPGKKHLQFLEKGFFVLTFLPIIYFFGQSFWVLLPLALMGVFLFMKFTYRAYVAFGVFLIWFFVIRANDMVILLEASAIFLYGLPVGSLLMFLSPATMAKLNKKVKIR